MAINLTDVNHLHLAGKLTEAPTKIRITSASNALSTALGAGVYVLQSDVDCFWRAKNGALEVGTSNGFMLFAGNPVEIPIEGTDDTNIAVICASGIAGYLDVIKRVR